MNFTETIKLFIYKPFVHLYFDGIFVATKLHAITLIRLIILVTRSHHWALYTAK
jgi:hypothetical protein